MRKKLSLLLLLLFIPVLAYAWGVAIIGSGSGTSAAGGCDDCSGTLALSWHCENVDVTLGTPCGCSDGDTTAEAVNSVELSETQKVDGTYAIYAPGLAEVDYYKFTDGGDFCNFSDANFAVTIKFWIYIDTFVDTAYLMSSYRDSNDKSYISLSGDSTHIDFSVYYEEGGGQQLTAAADTDCVEDTWYYVVVKYRTADLDPNLAIYVYSDEESTLIASGTDNTNLSPYDSGHAAYLSFGITSVNAAKVYMDKIELYHEWT